MTNLREILYRILDSLQYNNCVLAISHSDYRIAIGGTEKVLHEEQSLLADRNVSYIQVYPVVINNVEWVDPKLQLVGINVDGHPIGKVVASQLRRMLGLLQQFGVNFLAVHIHHLMGMGIDAVEEILRDLRADIRFFLHDYYSVCPQFNLLQNDRVYCAAPPLNSDTCRECKYGQQREQHLKSYEAFFRKHDIQFIAPSEVAKDIWSITYPSFTEKVRVYPHQVLIMKNSGRNSLTESRKVRVAYVGYQSDNKGWETWRSFVTHDLAKEYELYHLGAGYERFPNVTQVPVSFVEDGLNAMINALIDHDIDVAFLWSICPETYSFTVFESLAAGCFVVTNHHSGNIAVQVKRFSSGVVLKDREELYSFFGNPQRVKELINQTRQTFNGFSLYFNPTLADETAAAIELDTVAAGTELLSTNRVLAETEGWGNDEKWLQQITKFIEEINKLTELIEFLQSKHYEKDMAINSLRNELNTYTHDPVFRLFQKWKLALNRYPIINQIAKKVIQRLFR
jgi:hypothetical protein